MGTKVYDNYEDLITFNRNSKGTALRPIGYGDELVTNGTFDTDTSGWVLSQYNPSSSQSVVSGKLRLTIGGGESNARSSQAITTVIGTTYAYSVDAFQETSSVDPQFKVGTNAGSNNIVSINCGSSDGTFTGTFTATTTTTYITVQNNGGGDGAYADFDNVSVKEVLFDREDDPLTLFLHPEGVPRIEYDADRNLKGLLIEPESTNQIRNGSGTGAVVGTPGTLPTNWSTAGGLTEEIVATGTESGVSYVDIKFSGTATSTFAAIYFEPNDIISASDGETWTCSAFLKTIDATANYNSIRFRTYNYDSAPSFVGSQTGSDLTLTTDLQRYESTWTLSGATIAYSRPSIVFLLTNGNTYDFTVRIGWAQYEESPIATSPMPTTGSTFTRDKDEASMTSVSGLIGQTEGTLYIEVDWRLASGKYQILLDVTNGTSDNRMLIYKTTGNILQMVANADGGLLEVEVGQPSTAYSGIQKFAFAYKTDDFELYRNGSSIATDTSGSLASLATLTDIDIGQNVAAGDQANMHIRAVQIIPRRLSDAQLIELTS